MSNGNCTCAVEAQSAELILADRLLAEAREDRAGGQPVNALDTGLAPGVLR